MKSSVITFPGSNCDRDMDVALKKFGFKNQMVWHNDNELPKSDLVVLPGGFSYGDYLRCGSMAAKSKPVEELSLADLGIETNTVGWAGGRQKIVSIEPAPEREAGEIIEDEGDGHERIVAFLQEMKVI